MAYLTIASREERARTFTRVTRLRCAANSGETYVAGLDITCTLTFPSDRHKRHHDHSSHDTTEKKPKHEDKEKKKSSAPKDKDSTTIYIDDTSMLDNYSDNDTDDSYETDDAGSHSDTPKAKPPQKTEAHDSWSKQVHKTQQNTASPEFND